MNQKNTIAYWITGLALLIFVFLTFFHQITAFDQDLGRHILFGKIILASHSVPTTNLLAYTYPNFPFINSHWLSEVVFYSIFSLFTAKALLFLTIVVALATFFGMFSFLSKKILPISLATTFFLYIMILVERTDVRPEIFSFLFATLFTLILYKNREKFTKWLFLLPVIELLWVNMHIYFAVGPLLIFLFIVDRFVSNIRGGARSGSPMAGVPLWVDMELSSVRTPLSIVFLLSCLATLLNPNGLTGALYPLTVLNNYGYAIQENQNIFFLQSLGNKPTYTFFVISACLLFLLLLINRKKTHLIDWLLLGIFSYLGASQIRNTALFVFVTFPIFAIYLNQFIVRLFHEKNIRLQQIFSGIVFLLLVWEITYIIPIRGVGWDIGTRGKAGADFFIAQHLKGPIFNNFNVGSYLDYRFYPKERVFVDGRPEAYPVDFFQKEYIPMQEDPKVFDKVDQKYHFNTIFFAHTDQTPWAESFLKKIVKNPNWKLVFLDDSTIILVKNIPQNPQPAITEADIMSENLSFSNDYYALFQFAGVLNDIVGWKNAAIVILQKMLALQPHSCEVLRPLIQLLDQKNSPVTDVYYSQYQQLCQ